MPANCCRLCGATSYRPVLARDDGVLKPSGLFRCSGCSVVFEDPASWRESGRDSEVPEPLPPTPPAQAFVATIQVPREPSFSTYGLCPPRSPDT